MNERKVIDDPESGKCIEIRMLVAKIGFHYLQNILVSKSNVTSLRTIKTCSRSDVFDNANYRGCLIYYFLKCFRICNNHSCQIDQSSNRQILEKIVKIAKGVHGNRQRNRHKK